MLLLPPLLLLLFVGEEFEDEDEEEETAADAIASDMASSENGGAAASRLNDDCICPAADLSFPALLLELLLESLPKSMRRTCVWPWRDANSTALSMSALVSTRRGG